MSSSSSNVSQDTISSVQKKVLEQNEFQLLAVQQRNVLFLGSTRAGKTTAVNVLKNPVYNPEKYTLFSETIAAKLDSFAIKDNNKKSSPGTLPEPPTLSGGVLNGLGKNYTISVIDTPGLFEVVMSGSDRVARSNESILKTIDRCMESEIVKINAVVIFLTASAGISANDIECTRIFCKMFGEAARKTAERPVNSENPDEKQKPLRLALCFTHSEKFSDQMRHNILGDLKRQADMSEMIEKYNIEVLFSGCVEKSNLDGSTSINDLSSLYRDVYNMRVKLLEFILNASGTQSLLDMEMMKEKNEETLKTINNFRDSFRYFAEVRDFNLQEAAERVFAHKELQESVKQLSMGYVRSSMEIMDAFISAQAAAKEMLLRKILPPGMNQDDFDKRVQPLLLPFARESVLGMAQTRSEDLDPENF